MLNNLRETLGYRLERLGGAFASTGLSAGFWTATGLGLAFAAAAAYALDIGHAVIIGGALLLASGFFDVIDGQVARVTKSTSKRGAFLDSMSDKIAEVAIFLGILAGGLAEPYLVFLAVTMSLLVSYSRARAESLGVMLQGTGIGERAERLLVVALVGMAGFMEWGIIIVIIIAAVTLIQRMAAVLQKIRD